MKKLLLSLAMVAGLGFAANAQTKDAAMSGPKLGIGAEFGFPVDKGSDDSFLVGGSLRYEHPLSSVVRLTGSAGYTSSMVTGDTKKAYEAAGFDTSTGFIPVKAGAKFFLLENMYANGEVGAVFSTAKGGSTAFAFSPGLGIEFPVADKMAIDFGARYEGWSNNGTSSFIGLRAALNFGL